MSGCYQDYSSLLKVAYLKDKVKYMSHLNNNIGRYNYLQSQCNKAHVNMFDLGQQLVNLKITVGYQLEGLVAATGCKSLPIGDSKVDPKTGAIVKVTYNMNDFYKLVGLQNKMDNLGWQLEFNGYIPEECHVEKKIPLVRPKGQM